MLWTKKGLPDHYQFELQFELHIINWYSGSIIWFYNIYFLLWYLIVFFHVLSILTTFTFSVLSQTVWNRFGEVILWQPGCLNVNWFIYIYCLMFTMLNLSKLKIIFLTTSNTILRHQRQLFHLLSLYLLILRNFIFIAWTKPQVVYNKLKAQCYPVNIFRSLAALWIGSRSLLATRTVISGDDYGGTKLPIISPFQSELVSFQSSLKAVPHGACCRLVVIKEWISLTLTLHILHFLCNTFFASLLSKIIIIFIL